MTNKCKICGKSLSDEISVKNGIGPICRINLKEKAMLEKTGNLFTEHAKYSFRIDGHILAITDLNGAVSVTNDLKHVLNEIKEDLPKNLYIYKIMYKDSFGIWDGIRYPELSFFSINETDYIKAKTKLLNQ